MAFDYCANPHAVASQVGQYVANRVIVKRIHRKCAYLTEAELNALDRYALADDLIENGYFTTFHQHIGNDYDPDTLRRDIAREIDLRILKAFIKWRDGVDDNAMWWDIERTNLRFHFEENYMRAKREREYNATLQSIRPATYKQKVYAKRLLDEAGYEYGGDWDELTKGEAAYIIDWVLRDRTLPEHLAKQLSYVI